MKKIELTDEEAAELSASILMDMTSYERNPNGRNSWRCLHCGVWDYQDNLKHKTHCFGLRLLKKLREACH